jgi:hypothetical protein
MQGGVKVGDVRRHLSDLTEHVQLAAAPIARRALGAGQADIARHHRRSSATPRAWRLLRGRQERLEVGDAITAVPARVDAQDWQPLLLGPCPDCVGVNAQDASRQRDADRALAERG